MKRNAQRRDPSGNEWLSSLSKHSFSEVAWKATHFRRFTMMSLPEPLGGFHLPAPPPGAQLAEAVRASLGLLRLGPDRLTFPLLAGVYRVVLGDTDFSLHLAGPTGCYKTEAAALAQQHFGAGMDARHLPASWVSTGNALEGLAFAAKDALLVVDDFCPSGSVGDVQRYHKEADRLFRSQGNRAGRQRMRADASLRPAKPPRGLTLSTGEDTPRGQSLRARLLVLEISDGDFGPKPQDGPNRVLMGWERGYYYRVRKVSGRVVREYIGTGQVAELVARMDVLERESRRLKILELRREKAALPRRRIWQSARSGARRGARAGASATNCATPSGQAAGHSTSGARWPA